ncbi:host range and adsorption protein [Streptococcus phage CHPC640]|uniref:Peptidase C51 domain-containing protein n=1 Tax=Streptococcus phage CHPC640 TaxID=2365037 RepID=A0A3G8F6M9_9CAUD|nr:host range and adsorption protein [Streptococcus phage CHPC640]AZF90413.1 hypothetical protein CHPC640_0020 [Streptococcus phage CHPC640]
MLLTIHDNNLQKVAYIDNDKQSTLNFFNDKWTRSLESGTSVFEFSVFKKSITSNYNVETAYKYLNERAFVSFKYKGRSYLFNVMKVEEDENIIRCYCENLSLELLLEYRGAYKASKPMTFKEYFDDWGMERFAKLTLGVNEVSDQKRTLEWEGQETTLARLISLARNFDAEIEFETKLQPNSQLDAFILNVYKAHDGINQGVGRRRSDVFLKYGKNIKGIKRSVDKTQVYNLITPYGRKDDTKKETKRISDPVTIQNPVVVPSARVEKRYAGGDLTYAGHTLSASLVQTIFNLCVQRNLLPSGVISQLYLESFWGSSNVARRDNNWSGMTGGAQTRPSGVVVTTGSPRPASEGGTYMHYASVDDFMKDYTYLLAEQTSGGRKMYGVKGKQNIEEYTKGLFRIGGALYDYAAAGYNHYIYLMRDIRSGINRSNGNILDKLDDLWRQPDNQVTQPNQPITRTVKAEKVIAVLNEMQGLKGRRVGNGQCYALAAWYSMKLGGPGLGAGVTGKSGVIGAGMAAAKIGTDYAWDRFGWSVIRPTSVDQLKPGALANIKAYNSFLGTTVWGHNSIIIANNGSTVTVLEQNYAGRQYVVQNSYPASAYLGAIETLCYPPELREGKTVEGRTETVSSPNFEVQKVEIPPIDVEVTSESTAALTIDSKRKQEWKNDKGQVEFYLENGSLYAPISKELYPSILTGKENDDNWIRKDMEIDTDSEDVLISTALRNLRKFCYPAITYEVDGFLDLDIGDTVKIQDDGFKPMLILEARVSEQEISFSNPVENKTVFANFQALQNKVSDSLLSRMAKLAEQAIPYELKLSTDKGTTFKNSIGQSVLKATLEKNGEVYQPIFFYKNGDSIIGTGNQLVVKPTDFENTLQVTVEAYLDDELVATAEVTFTDVSDGKQGPKGDRGNDGIAGKDGVGLKTTTITYGISDSDTVMPNNWSSQVPTLVKGKYLWTKTQWTYTDGSSETGYQKTYIAKDGNKGNDGLPGKDGVGIRNTTITYAVGTSGTVAPTSGWSSQVPNVKEGQYLWTKTVWDYTDGTSEQGFSVAKMGEQGPKGDRGNDGLPGKDGVGLKTTTIIYGISDSDIAMPKNWSSQVPTLVKGKYLWTKTTWTYTDNSSETGYQKTYIAKDGNDGNDGLPGKDGVGLVDTTIEYLKHTDGQIAPNPKYYSSFNWKGLTLSQHLEHDWVNDLTLIKSGKPVKYTDLKVGELVIDRTGEIFPIKEIFGTEGDSSNPGYINLKPSIGKWSKDIPTVNPGEYLWTRTTWFYSDGTSEQGFSVAKMGEQGPKGDRGEQGPKGDQGIPGPKGADGRTQYTHIAYADTVSGSGFSQTDSNKSYIGMYQDFNAEDSNNPQDYRWSKWKGSDGKDGIPGKAGADGRTPYVHFAYADSADGRTGFSLTQTGRKRYLGVLTNFFKEDSTNPSDYTWNDTAGSISVGGDNLIINSAFPKNLDNWGFWETGLPNKNLHIATHDFYYNDTKNLFRLDSDGKGVPASSRRFPVKRNTDYSLNIQTFATWNIKGVTIYFLGRKANETDKTFTKVVHVKTYSGSPSVTQAVKWHLIFNSGDCDEGFIRIDNNGATDGKTSMLFFAELDCYEGTTDRVWQASTKDLEEEMETKADAAMTIEQINALNERAGIIKAEMEAKASAEILNNWIKNYQDFVKANETERAAAEKALVSSSQRVSTIAKDLGELSDRWNFIDTYMSSSNDGLVIGKNDGSSSMMFNPNGRISMYSAGEEVMYISQGVIHIENGIFSKTIQVGRYREEQYHLNPDMNVIRYVGGF